MIKLLLVALLSVGKIDSPFLAKGVGEVGALQLDPLPTIHMREIMSHEAHRHPYMEALGTIYLKKLRYGERFGSNAGSCWRLLFVYALMPWLQKYRIYGDRTDRRGSFAAIETQTSNYKESSVEPRSAAFTMNREASAVFVPRIFSGHVKKSTTLSNTDAPKVDQMSKELEELRAKLALYEETYGVCPQTLSSDDDPSAAEESLADK